MAEQPFPAIGVQRPSSPDSRPGGRSASPIPGGRLLELDTGLEFTWTGSGWTLADTHTPHLLSTLITAVREQTASQAIELRAIRRGLERALGLPPDALTE